MSCGMKRNFMGKTVLGLRISQSPGSKQRKIHFIHVLTYLSQNRLSLHNSLIFFVINFTQNFFAVSHLLFCTLIHHNLKQELLMRRGGYQTLETEQNSISLSECLVPATQNFESEYHFNLHYFMITSYHCLYSVVLKNPVNLLHFFINVIILI